MHQSSPVFSRFFALRAALAVLAAVCIAPTAPALPLRAPQPPVLAPQPAFVPDNAALAAVTSEKFPDADYVIVDTITRTRYAADGSSATLDTTLYKVLTEKGRRQLRTRSFNYNTFYENFKIASARILKPDAAPLVVDIAANSKEMVDRSSMGANIYDPDNKVVALTFPALEIGDAVEVTIEKTVKRSYMANTFFDWQTLESDSPILHLVYEVSGPAARPLKAIALLGKVRDTVQHTTRTDGTDTVHRWEARDVPQAFPEPAMPGLDSCGQRLRISTAATWEEVSKWYWDISEPHLKSTPAIDAKARELAADGTDDADKIRRIFRFVSQEIRYMGLTLEKDAPGFEPHDVKLTFENRYGVCRDKAALLVTMLRSAGFEAYPVLMMVGPLLDNEVPTPYFNHAITAVRHKDGTYQLMDTTNEHTADLLPAYLFNKSYLLSHPQGDTLRVSPVAPPEQNMLTGDTRLTLDASGDAKGEVTLDFAGINDNAFRAHLVRQKPEDTRRLFEAVVKDVVTGGTLTTLDVSPSNMQDTAKPIRIKIGFTAKNFFASTGTLLPTPLFAEKLAIASRILGNGTGLEKRRFPLDIPITCGFRETLTIGLPPTIGATLALPANETIEAPALRYTRQFARQGDTLSGTIELKLTAPRVEPDAYARLKTALKDTEYASRQYPVFARREATRTPDVRVVHRTQTVDVQDAHSWKILITEKRLVNTYAGKKDSGEIKIDYNPVWDTVTLVAAKVTLADGTERTVKPEEINQMDASWVATAPRYPAGKTLIVSLPGVEAGALVEYTIEHIVKDRPFFFLGKSFYSYDVVEKEDYTLNVPENLPLFTHTLADVGQNIIPAKTAQGAQNWQVRDAHYGNAQKENALPPAVGFIPHLYAGTLDSPRPFAEQVRAVAAPLLKPSAAIKAKADELLRGVTDGTDKIRILRDFVAKNIRLDGPNFTQLPLACLTAPEKTLADAYGNEADRALLLASLLTAANLHPQLLLTSSSPDTAFHWAGSPAPLPAGLFNRVIVSVPNGTDTLYLDQLSQYAALGTTALEGAQAISLTDIGAVFTLAPAADKRTRDTAEFRLTIEENGDAEIAVEQTFSGDNFEGFNRSFSEMTPEEKRRHYQQIVTGISQAAVPQGDWEADLKTHPGKFIFRVKVPRFAVRSGDYLYFELPGAVRSLLPAGADTRVNPFYIPTHSDAQRVWKIALPANVTVIAKPSDIDWKTPGTIGAVRV
ncbi:MAG: DUF3857 domain-containing protein, partial [Puniceicoccales bacterium]|nr:DUF3857 domain-containing protein [Puniceicoccales bacterium]